MTKKDIKCLEDRWKEIFKIIFADDKITRRDDTRKIIDFFEDLFNEVKQKENKMKKYQVVCYQTGKPYDEELFDADSLEEAQAEVLSGKNLKVEEVNEKPKWLNKEDWKFIKKVCGNNARNVAELMRDYACDVRDGRIILDTDDEN